MASQLRLACPVARMPANNLTQPAQRLVDGLGGPEDSRNVRVQYDHVGPLFVSLGVLATLRVAEVVFREHFRTPSWLRLFSHSSFARSEWHDAR